MATRRNPNWLDGQKNPDIPGSKLLFQQCLQPPLQFLLGIHSSLHLPDASPVLNTLSELYANFFSLHFF